MKKLVSSSSATLVSSVTQNSPVSPGEMYEAGSELGGDEVVPSGPVGAAGHVEEHDRVDLRLARLLEGEELEGLVECAEPTGQQHEAVGLLHERELAGEEVAEVDELPVVGENCVVAASNGS